MYTIPIQTNGWATIDRKEHDGKAGTSSWQTMQFDGLCVRIVEYSENYFADRWCPKGHIVYCIDGEFASELESGETFRLTKGMTYMVSDGQIFHRFVSVNGTKLLIIDGDFLKL